MVWSSSISFAYPTSQYEEWCLLEIYVYVDTLYNVSNNSSSYNACLYTFFTNHGYRDTKQVARILYHYRAWKFISSNDRWCLCIDSNGWIPYGKIKKGSPMFVIGNEWHDEKKRGDQFYSIFFWHAATYFIFFHPKTIQSFYVPYPSQTLRSETKRHKCISYHASIQTERFDSSSWDQTRSKTANWPITRVASAPDRLFRSLNFPCQVRSAWRAESKRWTLVKPPRSRSIDGPGRLVRSGSPGSVRVQRPLRTSGCSRKEREGRGGWWEITREIDARWGIQKQSFVKEKERRRNGWFIHIVVTSKPPPSLSLHSKLF